MSKRQTRKSVSISGEAYEELKKWCIRHNRSASGVIEDMVREAVGMPQRGMVDRPPSFKGAEPAPEMSVANPLVLVPKILEVPPPPKATAPTPQGDWFGKGIGEKEATATAPEPPKAAEVVRTTAYVTLQPSAPRPAAVAPKAIARPAPAPALPRREATIIPPSNRMAQVRPSRLPDQPSFRVASVPSTEALDNAKAKKEAKDVLAEVDAASRIFTF